MKKGDLRKQRILETAEALFFSKGYEQTTVQDILDALKLSKGGFYHYFATKEAVLLEVCKAHTGDRIAAMRDLFTGRMPLTERLNLLLRQINFAETESTELASVLIGLCYIDGDARILAQLRSCVYTLLLPILTELLTEGHDSGEFFVRNPQRMASIVLHIAECADDDCCRILAENRTQYDSILEALDVLNASRDAIERLISARYGTILLMDASKTAMACHAIQSELNRKEDETP